VSSAPGSSVAARLVDGGAAEDVVMMNADQFEAQVTVNLVELYVVVTDRAGKPVRDLGASDFTVLGNGVQQRVGAFSRAGELPIGGSRARLLAQHVRPDAGAAAGRRELRRRPDRAA
jgi:hypothetical protein